MSNDYGERQLSPRTLAGATVLQIVPALREEPVARTAVDVAHALLQYGARALVAADDGPLVAELKAFGGEWIPFVNATVNPFKLRKNARLLEELIAHERIDIIHAQSIGGGGGHGGFAGAARLGPATPAIDVAVGGKLVHSMYRDGGFPDHDKIINAVKAQLAEPV